MIITPAARGYPRDARYKPPRATLDPILTRKIEMRLPVSLFFLCCFPSTLFLFIANIDAGVINIFIKILSEIITYLVILILILIIIMKYLNSFTIVILFIIHSIIFFINNFINFNISICIFKISRFENSETFNIVKIFEF